MRRESELLWIYDCCLLCLPENGDHLRCSALLQSGRPRWSSHEQHLCSVLHNSSCTDSHLLCLRSTLLPLILQVLSTWHAVIGCVLCLTLCFICVLVPISMHSLTPSQLRWPQWWSHDNVEEWSAIAWFISLSVYRTICLLRIIILWGPFFLRSTVCWGPFSSEDSGLLRTIVLAGPLFSED